RKLPGITVDREGNITTGGKPVARVRINGKDFFGEDVQAATRNLPADILGNIQIIDDYGDAANLTGIKTGEPQKVTNANIRKDQSRGSFGQAAAGAGHRGSYLGSISANSLPGDRQICLRASVNNTTAALPGSGAEGGGHAKAGRKA